MKSSRYFLWLLLLIPVLWWAWPSSNDITMEPETQASPRGAASGRSSTTVAPAGGPAHAPTTAGRPRTDPARPLAPSFPEIDQILTDDTVTTEAAAIQLRGLAEANGLPTARRLEALQHGLNLDPAAFQSLASDPGLPAELALMLLHAFINFNESPAAQIQIYMALMNHSDEEVSTEARSMLAFQVGDTTEEPDPVQLIQMAEQKLQELPE